MTLTSPSKFPILPFAMTQERIDRVFDALYKLDHEVIPEWVLNLPRFEVNPDTQIAAINSSTPSSEISARFDTFLYFGDKNIKLRELKLIRGALELLSEPDLLRDYFPGEDNRLTVEEVRALGAEELAKLGLNKIQIAVVKKLFG